jgi:RNA polymerase sigma-70 factor (ECF subfamily)
MGSRDKEAISESYSNYSNIVFHVAFKKLSNIAAAEDITQEVFLKYIQNGKTFFNPAHAKSWFTRVTVNICKDVLKSDQYQSNVRLTKELSNILSTIVSVDDEIFVSQELNKLDKRERAVLRSHYFEGISVKEIAETLKLSEGAVKCRMYKARQKMKNNIEQQEQSWSQKPSQKRSMENE